MCSWQLAIGIVLKMQSDAVFSSESCLCSSSQSAAVEIAWTRRVNVAPRVRVMQANDDELAMRLSVCALGR